MGSLRLLRLIVFIFTNFSALVTANHFAYGTFYWTREKIESSNYVIFSEYGWKRKHSDFSNRDRYKINPNANPDDQSTSLIDTGQNTPSDGPTLRVDSQGNFNNYIVNGGRYVYFTNRNDRFFLCEPPQLILDRPEDDCLELANCGDKSCLLIVRVFQDTPNVEQQWFVGQMNYTHQTQEKKQRYIFNRGCCRITRNHFTIVDGNDIDVPWQLIASVDTTSNLLWGPRTTGYNRVYTPINKPMNYQIPVTNLIRRSMDLKFTFSLLSTDLKGNGDITSPRYSNSQKLNLLLPYSGLRYLANGMSLDEKTGVFSWVPTQLGLAMVQVTILDQTSSMYTVLDFIIEGVRDYTCKEAQDFNINTAPRFYPERAADNCRKECCELAEEPCDASTECNSCPFYPALTGIYEINAYDCQPGDTLTVSWGAKLPQIGISELWQKSKTSQWLEQNYEEVFNDEGPVDVRWSRLELIWTPDIDDIDQIVCLQAFDGALFSLGSYCLLLAIIQAPTIFISGIIRDFDADAEPDFGLQGPKDITDQFLEDTLDPLTWKPKLRPGVFDSIQSATSFQTWWSDKENKAEQTIFTIVLVQQGPKSAPYTFDSTSFTPINGRLLDRGKDPGIMNAFFTYEINTYMNMTQNHVYTFKAADDMWIFLNGKLLPDWTLFGIPGDGDVGRNYQMDVNKFVAANPEFKFGEIYRCDIFYASRAKNAANAPRRPVFGIQLPYTVLCSALEAGIVEFQTPENTFQFVPSASSSSSAVYDFVLGDGSQSSSFAAWVADERGEAQLMKVLQGFEAKFSFRVVLADGSVPGPTDYAPLLPGFAFVVHSSTPQASGKTGSGLGYSNRDRALAIEFDMFIDAQEDDPLFEHVSLHANVERDYQNTDLANERYSQGISLYIPNSNISGPLLTMDNSSWHDITIQFSPSKADETGIAYGWFRVKFNKVIRPVMEARLETSALVDMFNGAAAYVGFTSSTYAWPTRVVQFKDFKLKIVPVAPENTNMDALVDIEAGQLSIRTIETQDACGVKLAVGDEPNKFSASLTDVRTEEVLTEPEFTYQFVSNGDGTYALSYTCTRAGNMKMLVTFDGVSIRMESTNFLVSPAPTYAPKCEFMLQGAQVVDGIYEYPVDDEVYRVVRITPKDRYGNLQTKYLDSFVIYVSPANMDIKQPTISSNWKHKASFRVTEATDYTMTVRLGSVNVPFQGTDQGTDQATVRIVADTAKWPPSVSAGAGRLSGSAGETSTFTVTLKDQFENTVVDTSCDLSATMTFKGSSSSVNAVFNLEKRQWDMSYSENVIGSYTLSILLRGQEVETSTVTIGPGPIYPKECKAGANAEIARAPDGTAATFSAQIGSLKNFFVAIKDRFKNLRTDRNVQLTFETPGYDGAQFSYSWVNGVYMIGVTFTTLPNDAIIVRIKVNDDDYIGSDVTFNVIAGLCSSNSFVIPPTSRISAGESTQLKVICKDVENNDGTISQGAGSFQLVVKKNGVLQNVDVQYNLAESLKTAPRAEVYDVNSTVAGTLTVDVTAADLSAILTEAKAQVELRVWPDVTYAKACISQPPDFTRASAEPYSGLGHKTAVLNKNTSISIQARDRYYNVQDLSVDDDVKIETKDSTNAINSYTALKKTNSIYFTEFAITQSGSYTLKVFVNGIEAPNDWTPVTVQDNTQCNVRVIAPGPGKVGEVFTLNVIRIDSSNADYDWGENVYYFEVKATKDGVTVRAVSEESTNEVEFTQFFTPGAYNLDVTANGQACTITDGIGSIDVAVGDLYALDLKNLPRGSSSPVTAGVEQDFTIVPKDIYGNDISDGDYSFSFSAVHNDDAGASEEQKDCNMLVCSYKLTTPIGNWIFTVMVTKENEAIVVRGGNVSSVVVVPGSIQALSVQSEPNVVAGTLFEVLVELKDEFGNSIDLANSTKRAAAQSKLKYDKTDVLVDFSWVGGGKFRFFLNETKAGSMVIKVLYDQNVISSGTTEIMPAAISSLNASNGKYTAGEPMQVDVMFWDRYNNQVDRTAINTNVRGPTNLVYQPSRDGDQFKLAGNDATISGDYVWEFEAGDWVGNLTVTNEPGEVYVNNTILEPYIRTKVGEKTPLTVSLRDRYGNTVDRYNATEFRIVVYESIDCDDDDETSSTRTESSDFTQEGENITPDAVGDFVVTISYQDKTFQNCAQFTTLKVDPGLLDEAKSDVSLSTDTMIAGDILTITVILKDSNGNALNEDDDYANHFSLEFVNAKENDMTAQQLKEVTSSVSGRAEYQMDVQIRTAGESEEFSVKYNGTKLGNKILNITVVPASPQSFVILPLEHSVAGYWNSFSLQTKDKFGNSISASRSKKEIYYEADLKGLYYSVSTSIPLPTVNEAWTAYFLSTWSGEFNLKVEMYSNQSKNFIFGNFSQVLVLEPMLCPVNHFRCNRTNQFRCVDSYQNCEEQSTKCQPDQVKCADGKCKDSLADCDCEESGYHRCEGQGHCVKREDLCGDVETYTCPAHATVRCTGSDGKFSGVCRVTQEDCPSELVCEAGFFMCDNGMLCGKHSSDCPHLPTHCPDGYSLCPDGKCTQSVDSCSTRITCPKDLKLCTDGRCVGNTTKCADVIPVANPKSPPFNGIETTLPVCSDGTRVNNSDTDCPSQRTCPPGYLLCDNLLCALELKFCGYRAGDVGVACKENTYRCADGSCVDNPYHCPTPTVCPNGTVLCQDGTCTVSSEGCSVVQACTRGRTCPDGTCAGDSVECPTGIKCPLGFVKCASGNCVNSTEKCTNTLTCPSETPARCSDGTCRNNLDNCPTLVKCPSQRNQLCMDGSCVADVNNCPSPDKLICPEGTVRCVSGVCTSSKCPSQTSCPIDYQRCEDGTCRKECALLSATCGNQIKCPMVLQGNECRNTLADCPHISVAVCPSSSPVRCSDSSCKTTRDDCPTPPSISGDISACSDGTLSLVGGCASPLYCKEPTPYPCFDQQTCRTLATDCPLPPVCPASSPLFCVATFSCMTNKNYQQECRSPNGPCPPSTPFRCASGCVASLDECDSSGSIDECLVRCRDGTCAGLDPSACISSTGCDVRAGYEECWNGFCSPSFLSEGGSFCPNRENACPYNKEYRCTATGLCEVDGDSCPDPDDSLCSEGQFLADGFCINNIEDLRTQFTDSGCPWDTPVRCHDLRCVVSESECWTRECPANQPVLCPNGYCAATQNLCPSIPLEYCKHINSTEIVPCADGTCQASTEFCSPIRPCGAGEERCEDGSCAVCNEDFCGCRVVKVCGWILGHRCEDGLCANSSSACRIQDSAKGDVGCTEELPVLCANHACVSDRSECPSTEAEGQGCDVAQVKCWDGACAKDPSECRLLNGCNSTAPKKCPIGKECVPSLDKCRQTPDCTKTCWDGQCVTDITNCKTKVGCPLDKPVRCVNGECRKYSSTSSAKNPAEKCPFVTTCNDREKLCYDGSCQEDLNSCLYIPACPKNQSSRCHDGSCRESVTDCKDQTCGSGLFACPNGECRRDSVLKCPGVARTYTIGVSTGGSSQGSDETSFVDLSYISPGCSASKPVGCFDGSCAASPLECMQRQMSYRGVQERLTSASGICPDGDTLCFDGSCVSDKFDCKIIPSCPRNQMRCPDGSCQGFDDDCGNAQASGRRLSESKCDEGTRLCEDGVCRVECLRYDGCPLSSPYHCWNRECATTKQGCGPEGVELQCSTGCNAQEKAQVIDITVDLENERPIVFAVGLDNSAIASIAVPSGSIDGNSQPVIYIRPVAESEMRGAENIVHPSRQEDFQTDKLSFSQSVLSAAFRCSLDEGNSLQNEGLDFSAVIDYDVTSDLTPEQKKWANPATDKDVCLAFLFEIDRLNYKRWQCVTEDRYSPPFPAAADSLTPYNVKGNIMNCGVKGSDKQGDIYAFVRIPRPDLNTQIRPESNWLLDNLLWVLLIVSACSAVLALCAYYTWRGSRYKTKLIQEKAKVAEWEERVADIEQHGAAAGPKDEEVMMSENPMVLQHSQLQKMHDMKSKEEMEKEQKEREEAAANRADYMAELEKDKSKMQQDLDKKKIELQQVQKQTALAGGNRRLSDAPAAVSEPAKAPGDTSGPTRNVTVTTKQANRNLGAAAPKKKKKPLK